MITIVCRTKVSNTLKLRSLKIMKSSTLVSFAKRVREERKRIGISQEELAERAGVHRTYVGMIERAEKNITLENIKKIASALKMPISKLLESL